ncbi:MAG: hypothetical protein Q8P49_03700 [Candidatus Liptonbacteria bacterium]|nr:hypothetical protein [Candidatus Liptonbacteria bacterium]
MDFLKIPQHISDETFLILTREDTAALIESIAEEFGVATDHTGKISAIAGRAIMRVLPLAQVAPALQEKLGVEKETAQHIALAILLKILYPFWPLYPDIDGVIKSLGGEVPTEKPPMPKLSQEPMEPISYPVTKKVMNQEPELFGGLEIPVPPAPKNGNQRPAGGNRILERDVPWTPQNFTNDQRLTTDNGKQNIAKPGDVAKLLEKSLLKENN